MLIYTYIDLYKYGCIPYIYIYMYVCIEESRTDELVSNTKSNKKPLPEQNVQSTRYFPKRPSSIESYFTPFYF